MKTKILRLVSLWSGVMLIAVGVADGRPVPLVLYSLVAAALFAVRELCMRD